MKASEKVAWAMAHGWRLELAGRGRRWSLRHADGRWFGARAHRALISCLTELYWFHVGAWGPEPHGPGVHS